MAMSYDSLTAAKGTAGAITTWVSYTLLDIPTILDEAQTLLWPRAGCAPEQCSRNTSSPSSNVTTLNLSLGRARRPLTRPISEASGFGRPSGQECGLRRLIRSWSSLVLIGSTPVAGTAGIKNA
jgi:hypothetical protein